ncbi:MAG: methionyl-tRNA formyltransferase [Thauera sp.]
MAPAPTPPALRVAFAGTPEFAAQALRAILDAGYPVPLVLTQPDRPAGRGMKLTPSPVKQLALAHGIEVDQPEKLRTEEQRARLAACAPDVLVVAAYGLILPKAVLDLPRLGCINIHASLLPRWRGAAPIHRAIEAGDAETGITIMQMDEGLDTGAMLLRRALPILPADTTAGLHDRLALLGGECIVDALAALQRGALVATAQPADGVTYAAKIGRAEAAIDWTRPAAEIERAMRAFDPFPGAASALRDTVVKCWSGTVVPGTGAPGSVLAVDEAGITIACGRDALRCTVLQRPGSKRLPAGEFLRGFPVSVGERFTTPA